MVARLCLWCIIKNEVNNQQTNCTDRMVSKVTNFDAQSWNPNKNNVKLKKKKYFPFSLGVNPQGKFEESRRGGGEENNLKQHFHHWLSKSGFLQVVLIFQSGIQTSNLFFWFQGSKPALLLVNVGVLSRTRTFLSQGSKPAHLLLVLGFILAPIQPLQPLVFLNHRFS